MSLPRIIILGAGLGGTIAAYEIRDAAKGRAEVIVVNDSEDYWFVPSTPGSPCTGASPMRSGSTCHR